MASSYTVDDQRSLPVHALDEWYLPLVVDFAHVSMAFQALQHSESRLAGAAKSSLGVVCRNVDSSG